MKPFIFGRILLTCKVVALTLLLLGGAFAGFAGNGSAKGRDKIFEDSTGAASHQIKFHHHFELGVLCRIGKENVFTYSGYNHQTSKTSNYIVGLNTRFLSLRLSHGLVFHKTFEAGVAYGADVYIQAHDTRAFVPLMVYVLHNTRLTQRLALVFAQQPGYAFFFRSKLYNPFLQYTGVEGGFTSETLIGLGIRAKHKNYVQLIFGYRFQHLNSKSVFSPDQNLTTYAGSHGDLPAKITETANGFYHFIYFSLGVPF